MEQPDPRPAQALARNVDVDEKKERKVHADAQDADAEERQLTLEEQKREAAACDAEYDRLLDKTALGKGERMEEQFLAGLLKAAQNEMEFVLLVLKSVGQSKTSGPEYLIELLKKLGIFQAGLRENQEPDLFEDWLARMEAFKAELSAAGEKQDLPDLIRKMEDFEDELRSLRKKDTSELLIELQQSRTAVYRGLKAYQKKPEPASIRELLKDIEKFKTELSAYHRKQQDLVPTKLLRQWLSSMRNTFPYLQAKNPSAPAFQVTAVLEKIDSLLFQLEQPSPLRKKKRVDLEKATKVLQEKQKVVTDHYSELEAQVKPLIYFWINFAKDCAKKTEQTNDPKIHRRFHLLIAQKITYAAGSEVGLKDLVQQTSRLCWYLFWLKNKKQILPSQIKKEEKKRADQPAIKDDADINQLYELLYKVHWAREVPFVKAFAKDAGGQVNPDYQAQQKAISKRDTDLDYVSAAKKKIQDQLLELEGSPLPKFTTPSTFIEWITMFTEFIEHAEKHALLQVSLAQGRNCYFKCFGELPSDGIFAQASLTEEQAQARIRKLNKTLIKYRDLNEFNLTDLDRDLDQAKEHLQGLRQIEKRGELAKKKLKQLLPQFPSFSAKLKEHLRLYGADYDVPAQEQSNRDHLIDVAKAEELRNGDRVEQALGKIKIHKEIIRLKREIAKAKWEVLKKFRVQLQTKRKDPRDIIEETDYLDTEFEEPVAGQDLPDADKPLGVAGRDELDKLRQLQALLSGLAQSEESLPRSRSIAEGLEKPDTPPKEKLAAEEKQEKDKKATPPPLSLKQRLAAKLRDTAEAYYQACKAEFFAQTRCLGAAAKKNKTQALEDFEAAKDLAQHLKPEVERLNGLADELLQIDNALKDAEIGETEAERRLQGAEQRAEQQEKLLIEQISAKLTELGKEPIIFEPVTSNVNSRGRQAIAWLKKNNTPVPVELLRDIDLYEQSQAAVAAVVQDLRKFQAIKPTKEFEKLALVRKIEGALPPLPAVRKEEKGRQQPASPPVVDHPLVEDAIEQLREDSKARDVKHSTPQKTDSKRRENSELDSAAIRLGSPDPLLSSPQDSDLNALQDRFSQVSEIKSLSVSMEADKARVKDLEAQLEDAKSASSNKDSDEPSNQWTIEGVMKTARGAVKQALWGPQAQVLLNGSSDSEEAPSTPQSRKPNIPALRSQLNEAKAQLSKVEERQQRLLHEFTAPQQPQDQPLPVAADARASWPRSRIRATDIWDTARPFLVVFTGFWIGYLALRTTGIGYLLFGEAALANEALITLGIYLGTYYISYQFAHPINLRTARSGWDHIFANVENVQTVIDQNQILDLHVAQEDRVYLQESQRRVLYEFCDAVVRTADPRRASGRRINIARWNQDREARGQEPAFHRDGLFLARLRNQLSRGQGLRPRQVSLDINDLNRLQEILLSIRRPQLLGTELPPKSWREKNPKLTLAIEFSAVAVTGVALLLPGLFAGNVELITDDFITHLQETYGYTLSAALKIGEIIAWSFFYLPCSIAAMGAVYMPRISGRPLAGQQNYLDYQTYIAALRNLIEAGHGKVVRRQVRDRNLMVVQPYRRPPLVNIELSTHRPAIAMKFFYLIMVTMGYLLMKRTGRAFNQNDETIFGPKRLDNDALIDNDVLIFNLGLLQLHFLKILGTRSYNYWEQAQARRAAVAVGRRLPPWVAAPAAAVAPPGADPASPTQPLHAPALSDTLDEDEYDNLLPGDDTTPVAQAGDLNWDPEFNNSMGSRRTSNALNQKEEYVLEMYWPPKPPDAVSNLVTERPPHQDSKESHSRIVANLQRSRQVSASVNHEPEYQAELEVLVGDIKNLEDALTVVAQGLWTEIEAFGGGNLQKLDSRLLQNLERAILKHQSELVEEFAHMEEPLQEELVSLSRQVQEESGRESADLRELPERAERQRLKKMSGQLKNIADLRRARERRGELEILLGQWEQESNPGSRASISRLSVSRDAKETPLYLRFQDPMLPAQPKNPWNLVSNKLVKVPQSDLQQVYELCEAIEQGELEVVKRILLAKPNLLHLQITYHIKDFVHDNWQNFNLLHLALAHGKFKIAHYLVNLDIDLAVIAQGENEGLSTFATARDFAEKLLPAVWSRATKADLELAAVQATMRTKGAKTFADYRQPARAHHQLRIQPQDYKSRRGAAPDAGMFQRPYSPRLVRTPSPSLLSPASFLSPPPVGPASASSSSSSRVASAPAAAPPNLFSEEQEPVPGQKQEEVAWWGRGARQFRPFAPNAFHAMVHRFVEADDRQDGEDDDGLVPYFGSPSSSPAKAE